MFLLIEEALEFHGVEGKSEEEENLLVMDTTEESILHLHHVEKDS